METITILIICGFMGWFFAKSLRTETTSKSNITRIDDKNWIVNNEFVSFEEDTPILRFKQEMEDNKHYRNYESEKLSRDRERIFKDWMKTTQAIHSHSDLKNCVTEEKLEAITEKYDKYLFMCKKLDEATMILSKEEFLIKEENPMFCVDWTNMMWFPKHLGFYEIHNEKTAKYCKGNMSELIAKEFETKWY
jgi:protease II